MGRLATYYVYGQLPTAKVIPFKVCTQVAAYRSRLQMPSVQAGRSGGLLLLLQQPCYTRYHSLQQKLH